MSRPVILSNGRLAVGINQQGLVHDFYYPYVGLDNLTTSRSVHHSIGVWINGLFSWVNDDDWQISVNFEEDALVSVIHMSNSNLQVELDFNDFVDPEVNAFCRRIRVTNTADHPREIRLFLHQVFQISRAGRADTALFVPEANYILDYKGRCSLIIYAQLANGKPYDQFAIGNYGIEGKEGTFRDAEDGELSGSAVEHGGVDSVMRFSMQLDQAAYQDVDYWIVAADSQFSAENIHVKLLKDTLPSHLETTRRYWHDWLSIGNGLSQLPDRYTSIVKKSLMVIKAHCDKRGGIIASCDSSIYNYGRDYYSYVWPRDGAYVIWPLIRLGYTEEPKKFFEFCRDILTPDGFLMHKYQPDRAIGSTWHPLLHGRRRELAIQEDETAIVLFMLGEFLQQSGDTDFVRSLYDTFIQPAANFLDSFIDPQTKLPHASYDLWEEKFLTTTYTAAVVYQALIVAGDLAETFEYPDDAVKWRSTADALLANFDKLYDKDLNIYRKGFLLDNDGLNFDNTLDVSSLYGVMMFGYHPSFVPQIKQMAQAVENNLLDQSPSGGCPRYQNDHYFASSKPYVGNPWFVTTLWMAQYYLRIDEKAKAASLLDWAVSKCLPSGVFPEQIDPESGQPISVAPLVWSHAELLNTLLDFSKSK